MLVWAHQEDMRFNPVIFFQLHYKHDSCRVPPPKRNFQTKSSVSVLFKSSCPRRDGLNSHSPRRPLWLRSLLAVSLVEFIARVSELGSYIAFSSQFTTHVYASGTPTATLNGKSLQPQGFSQGHVHIVYAPHNNDAVITARKVSFICFFA